MNSPPGLLQPHVSVHSIRVDHPLPRLKRYAKTPRVDSTDRSEDYT